MGDATDICQLIVWFVAVRWLFSEGATRYNHVAWAPIRFVHYRGACFKSRRWSRSVQRSTRRARWRYRRVFFVVALRAPHDVCVAHGRPSVRTHMRRLTGVRRCDRRHVSPSEFLRGHTGNVLCAARLLPCHAARVDAEHLEASPSRAPTSAGYGRLGRCARGSWRGARVWSLRRPPMGRRFHILMTKVMSRIARFLRFTS